MSRHPVLRVGDQVQLDGRSHTVVGLSGTVVRLADEAGRASLVLLSHLLSAEDFEFLGQRDGSPVVAPFALLDTVPPQEAEKAAAWERHLLELEAGGGTEVEQRSEYDPALHTVEERIAAKAAELRSLGWAVSTRTVERMRARYRDQGVWGWSTTARRVCPRQRAGPMSGWWQPSRRCWPARWTSRPARGAGFAAGSRRCWPSGMAPEWCRCRRSRRSTGLSRR